MDDITYEPRFRWLPSSPSPSGTVYWCRNISGGSAVYLVHRGWAWHVEHRSRWGRLISDRRFWHYDDATEAFGKTMTEAIEKCSSL